MLYYANNYNIIKIYIVHILLSSYTYKRTCNEWLYLSHLYYLYETEISIRLYLFIFINYYQIG